MNSNILLSLAGNYVLFGCQLENKITMDYDVIWLSSFWEIMCFIK